MNDPEMDERAGERSPPFATHRERAEIRAPTDGVRDGRVGPGNAAQSHGHVDQDIQRDQSKCDGRREFDARGRGGRCGNLAATLAFRGYGRAEGEAAEFLAAFRTVRHLEIFPFRNRRSSSRQWEPNDARATISFQVI
jgi:hypothetical protein